MYQISSVHPPGSNSFLPTLILPACLPKAFLPLILLHFWGTEVPELVQYSLRVLLLSMHILSFQSFQDFSNPEGVVRMLSVIQ